MIDDVGFASFLLTFAVSWQNVLFWKRHILKSIWFSPSFMVLYSEHKATFRTWNWWVSVMQSLHYGYPVSCTVCADACMRFVLSSPVLLSHVVAWLHNSDTALKQGAAKVTLHYVATCQAATSSDPTQWWWNTNLASLTHFLLLSSKVDFGSEWITGEVQVNSWLTWWDF